MDSILHIRGLTQPISPHVDRNGVGAGKVSALGKKPLQKHGPDALAAELKSPVCFQGKPRG
ncbi:hypothetical protein NHF53_08870 [Ciceribacter sp. RN22]|nr:hypothetical protein [Ciceribacter sp. RN22]